MNTNENLFEHLGCPKCKKELLRNAELLTCGHCNLSYALRNGIPVLIDLTTLPPHLQSQIEYFENEAVSDEEYHLEPWQVSYIQRFQDTFPDIGGKVIIDCGTGSGYMAIELAKRGATILACDLTLKSLIRLKQAAKKEGLEKQILLVCCSAESLPFQAGRADYFISNAVLEHLPHEKEAIQEINRVCSQSAGLMIAVPLAYRYLNPLLLPVNYVHDKRIGHLRRYDESILLKKFPGYSLIRSYYTGHFVKVLKTLVNMIVPFFDARRIEQSDRRGIGNKWGASNIICFLKRAG